MAVGYDIGASSSTSSGVQSEGGKISTGDFIVGGSGGASKTPLWMLIAGGVLVVVGIFAFMLRRK